VKWIERWPVVRQLRQGDPLGLGPAAQSQRSKTLTPRIDEAEHVVQSICPYCAVGCGQRVYHRDGKLLSIEGDPASPISEGHLCPKGAASYELLTHPARATRVKYRAPYATEWQDLDLHTALDMIAVWRSRSCHSVAYGARYFTRVARAGCVSSS